MNALKGMKLCYKDRDTVKAWTANIKVSLADISNEYALFTWEHYRIDNKMIVVYPDLTLNSK